MIFRAPAWWRMPCAGWLSITAVVVAAAALEQALRREERGEIERAMESLEAALTSVLAGLEGLPPALP